MGGDILSNKLLINSKDRKLLLFSDFVKNTEPKIFGILEENNTISMDLAIQLNIFDKIKQSLPFWLEFSRKEWIPDKQNPRLVAKNGDFKNCQLCATPNKFQYKIENKTNGNVLLIGGDCVNSFKELRTMKALITNDEEYTRYQNLLSYNPYFYEVLVTNTNILTSTKIILPSYYKDSFKKIQKRLIQKLRGYIKHGQELNEKEISHLIAVYKNEIQTINEFVNKNKNNDDYLSRDIANKIKKNQKNEFEKILDSVENNGGRIPKFTSLIIKVESYLDIFVKKIKYRLPKMFNLVRAQFGAFELIVTNEKVDYKFKIDSKLLMTQYFENKLKSISEFFLNNIDVLVINDPSTRDKLVQKGQSKILEEMSGEFYEVNIKKIIHMYDKNLTSKEYAETYNKVESIIENFFVVKNPKDEVLSIFPINDLIPIGKKLLFSDGKINLNELHYRKVTVKDFQQFIVSQII